MNYQEEARQHWGTTDAWKQSQERIQKMTQADFARIATEGEKLMQAILIAMPQGAASQAVQQLIAQHYNNLRHFYEPNVKMYRGLANMYVDDVRFAAFYQKFHPDMAHFMRDAMVAYCDTEERLTAG